MTSKNRIVKLNIGGTVFHTTVSTLTRFDGFFKTLLETDVPVTKDDTGSIFVDRDPTYFRFILNFMRDGDVELPDSKKELKEIHIEAQYYLLKDLCELCNTRLTECDSDNEKDVIKFLNTDEEKFAAIMNLNKFTVIVFLPKSSTYNATFSWKAFVQRNRSKWEIYFRIHNDVFNWHFFCHDRNLEGSSRSCNYSHCSCCLMEYPEQVEFHMQEFLASAD
uniref:BTB domain-containing protein n=1 Tax=Caenorhabditis tropicalis TaxID=1561998 RepID=A0A1I7T5D3_9PELO